VNIGMFNGQGIARRHQAEKQLCISMASRAYYRRSGIARGARYINKRCGIK